MNSHLRPYNRCISNISTNIYLGLDLSIKICLSVFQMSTNNDLIYKPINKNILHIFYYISFTFLNNNTNQ